MIKKSTLAFSLLALGLGACSNLQTEYEKQAAMIEEQKVIIRELSETNAHLKGENLRLDAESRKAAVRTSYSSNVATLSRSYEDKLNKMINAINRQLDSSLSSTPGVTQRETSEGTVIRMAESILFKSGSADLSTGGKGVLKTVADIIRKYPSQKIRIDGHSDSDPINKSKKKFSSNWDLAATRAVRVAEELTGKGISGEQVTVSAYSMYQPVESGNKKLNRRVEIVILK